MKRNEFVWKGKLFRRAPNSTLFVSVSEIIHSCDNCLQDHLALGVTVVDESKIHEMIFSQYTPSGRVA